MSDTGTIKQYGVGSNQARTGQPRPGKKRLAIVFLIIAAVFVAVGCLAWVLSSNSDSTPVAAPSQVEVFHEQGSLPDGIVKNADDSVSCDTRVNTLRLNLSSSITDNGTTITVTQPPAKDGYIVSFTDGPSAAMSAIVDGMYPVTLGADTAPVNGQSPSLFFAYHSFGDGKVIMRIALCAGGR